MTKRGPVAGPPAKAFLVYIRPVSLYDRLRAEAYRRHVPLSSLVCELVTAGLEKERKE